VTIQSRNDDDHYDNSDIGDVLKQGVLVLAHGLLVVEEQDEKDQRRGQDQCDFSEDSGWLSNCLEKNNDF
jgi:hypothetical protein